MVDVRILVRIAPYLSIQGASVALPFVHTYMYDFALIGYSRGSQTLHNLVAVFNDIAAQYCSKKQLVKDTMAKNDYSIQRLAAKVEALANWLIGYCMGNPCCRLRWDFLNVF